MNIGSQKPNPKTTISNPKSNCKMTLSCLSHVKRGADGVRPDPIPFHVDSGAVIDRSGSMASVLPGAIAGVRGFAEDQRARNDDSHFEFVSFDDKVEIPYSGPTRLMTSTDVDACVASVFARDRTRLYDTAIEAIHRQDKRLTAWRASLPRMVRARLQPKMVVILFVLTDGLDNVSLANKAAFARALENHKRKWGGWSGKNVTAIFAAANQDAMAAGASYGFNADTCLQVDHDAVHTQAAFKCASASAARACSGAPVRMTRRERQTTTSGYYKNTTCPPGLNYGAPNDSDDDDSDCDSNMACMGGGGTPAVTPLRNHHYRPRRMPAWRGRGARACTPSAPAHNMLYQTSRLLPPPAPRAMAGTNYPQPALMHTAAGIPNAAAAAAAAAGAAIAAATLPVPPRCRARRLNTVTPANVKKSNS